MYYRKEMSWNLERVLFTLRKWPTSTAEPLVHLVCRVVSQTAKSIRFLAVRMLQFKTWWLKDIKLLPGPSSKPWTKATLEETSCLQILEVKHGWLNKVWSCRHMQPTGLYPNGIYQTFQQTNFNPVQDQMVFAYCQLERKMAIRETYRLYTLRAGMYTSFK